MIVFLGLAAFLWLVFNMEGRAVTRRTDEYYRSRITPVVVREQVYPPAITELADSQRRHCQLSWHKRGS